MQTTGERPGEGAGFDYDESRHLVAYLHALPLAAGLRVLDAGCGEGFGTQLLADRATSVLGVDYAPDAIAACCGRWHKPNLTFAEADLTALPELHPPFDLIVNFQVLEHIRDEVAYLEGLARLLAPGGTLLLTTPNALRSFSENPYHLREYRADELHALLSRVFGSVELAGVHGNARVEAFDRRRERAVRRLLALDPLGLRHRLPDRLVKAVFARLAVVVRRRAKRSGAAGLIVPADFTVRPEHLDSALDLVASCRR